MKLGLVPRAHMLTLFSFQEFFFISFLQQISIFSLYLENKTLGATEEVVNEWQIVG